MKRSKKIFIGVISSIIALFLIFNVFWFSYRELRYKPFCQGFEDFYGVSEKIEDNIRYDVWKPHYLSFGGNLTVQLCGDKYVSKSGKVYDAAENEGLIIWPQFPSGYKYAVELELKHSYNAARKEEYSEDIVVLIDENGEWIDTSGVFTKEQKLAFEERKEFIKELLKDTKEFWPLD